MPTKFCTLIVISESVIIQETENTPEFKLGRTAHTHEEDRQDSTKQDKNCSFFMSTLAAH